MQEVNYKITIVDESGGKKTPVSTQQAPEGTEAGQAVSQAVASSNKDKGLVASGLVAVQQITPYVNQIANFSVSQIGANTGAWELQQRTQFLAGLASSATTIAMGFAVGGPVGALATLGMQAVGSAISMAQKSAEIDTQRRIEAENISLRSSRLGQAVNRSRGGTVS